MSTEAVCLHIYLVTATNGHLTAPATSTLTYQGTAPPGSFTIGTPTTGTGRPSAIKVTKGRDGTLTAAIPPGRYDPNNPAHYLVIPITAHRAGRLAWHSTGHSSQAAGCGIQPRATLTVAAPPRPKPKPRPHRHEKPILPPNCRATTGHSC